MGTVISWILSELIVTKDERTHVILTVGFLLILIPEIS
jgi:hypothetical protein|nr:MAG TPA: hypothetical protein [Herelleviridae sp.]